MNLRDLSDLALIVGAVGVIVSLIYPTSRRVQTGS